MGLRAAVLIFLTVIRLYELKKLAKENFSEPALSPLPVRLQYSHPPLGERIANAFRCLRDRGLAYTIRRILFGRQPD